MNNDIEKIEKFNKKFSVWYIGFVVALMFSMVFYLEFYYFLPLVFLFFTGVMMIYSRVVYSYLRILNAIEAPEQYVPNDPEDPK